MSKTYIFNQYYINLIKLLKKITKNNKDKSKTCKKIFNSIKKNYLNIDKNTDEYTIFINNYLTSDLFESYKNISVNIEQEKVQEDTEQEKVQEDTEQNDINELANKWLTENSTLQLFQDIILEDIRKVLKDDFLCHHYISLFFILTREKLTDEEAKNIINLLQMSNYDDELKELDDTNDIYKKILVNLQYIKHVKIKKSIDFNMGGMENTTLGKLAKEILEDVDVNKLQKSMGENGDVLKSLGDPNSGFGDIISNVSQKMATKLSNGELNQENLMKDAMKFASMMPGMFGNQNQQNNKGGGANMGNMMNMFADLMSNSNDNDMPDLNTMKNMANKMNKSKNSRGSFNDSAYRKLAAQKKAKQKLSKKLNNNID